MCVEVMCSKRIVITKNRNNQNNLKQSKSNYFKRLFSHRLVMNMHPTAKNLECFQNVLKGRSIAVKSNLETDITTKMGSNEL